MRVNISDPTSRAIAQTELPPAPQAQPNAAVPSAFAQVLREVGHAIDSGEAEMQAAIRSMRAGTDLGPAGLIALQMRAYRYGEVIDLVSRVVDRATGGVKTIVQGGGQ